MKRILSSTVALLMFGTAALSQPPVVGTIETHTMTILCDESEQVEHILTAQAQTSIRAGVEIFQMYNKQMNDIDEPACSFIKAPHAITVAIVELSAVIENVNWFDGKQHTMYVVSVFYKRANGEFAGGYIYTSEKPISQSEVRPAGTDA